MERFRLWWITRLSFAQGRPQEFLGIWSIVGVASLIDVAYILVRGDGRFDIGVVVPALLGALGLLLAGVGAADMRFPCTIEGRVTRSEHRRVRRPNAAAVGLSPSRLDQEGVYIRRITIEDDRGRPLTFRAAAGGYYGLSSGDVVRLKVGPRLRWIYDIRVIRRARPAAS
ncbi:MAG: hypothetical protein ACRDP6_17345 [Actinoallomurus sp.]